MDDTVKRINELAKKKKQQGLTREETAEQKQLYQRYLASFRKSFERQLENTDVEFPDGSVLPFKEANKKKE